MDTKQLQETLPSSPTPVFSAAVKLLSLFWAVDMAIVQNALMHTFTPTLLSNQAR